jgi:hypothetical protein
VDLQAQGSRAAQPRGASESLEGNDRLVAERKMNDVPDAQRRQRFADRPLDDPAGVAIERVGGPVRRLGLPHEAIEERRAAGADDQGAGRPGQKLLGGTGAGGFIETRQRQRQQNVQAASAQGGLERRQNVCASWRRGRERRRAPT